MKEETRIIATADGPMDTFVCMPETGGPFAPILFYMDAIGVRDELKDMARRIAQQGYAVFLPNLFYRTGPADSIVVDAGKIEDKGGPVRKLMWSLIKSIDNGAIVADTAPLLKALKEDDAVRPGPVGCVGYCMSGQYVYSVAGHYPDEFAAVASFYGAGLVTDRPDSPHLLTDRIKAELYLAFAETDSYVPHEDVERLRDILGQSDVAHAIDVYPGTEHGFAFPERHCYDEAAAAHHWERIFDLFERRLAA